MSPPTPASRTTGASPTTMSRRLRQLGLSGRRLRRGWTRQRWMEVVHTLAYVVPLTLLIWVWAQHQQIGNLQRQNVPVAVGHADGQKVVTVLRAGSGDAVATDDGRVLTTLTLQGPRTGLNAVARALDDPRSRIFEMKVQSATTDQTTVPLRTYLDGTPLLQDAGVSVMDVTPSDLVVRVEERRQEAARLEPGGELKAEDLAAPPVFDPPTVEVSGPASVVNQLPRGPGGEVKLEVGLPEASPPGEQSISADVLVPEALRGRIQLNPATVNVQFTRREQRQERYTILSVAVYSKVPGAMSNVLVTIDPPVVNNVIVEGPADVIARIRGNQLRDAVYAEVRIERDDEEIGQGQRAVRMQLPPGVALVSEAPVVRFSIRRTD